MPWRQSPVGVKFKISDEHPRMFHMGVPPPPPGAGCTAILLSCTVYSTFFLCLQVCFPFLLSEYRFCLFSLNFVSLVFYFSERVVVNDCPQLSILNIKTTRTTFPAVGYRRFYFFVYILVQLPTSPSFIRIHFKTLRLVCVISSFYKAFVQF